MKKLILVLCAVFSMAVPLTFGATKTLAAGPSLSISTNFYTDASQTITNVSCSAPPTYAYSGSVYIYDNNNNNVFGSGMFDICMSVNSSYNGAQIGGTTGFVIPSNDAAYNGTWTMVLEQDNSQSFPTLSDALSSPKYLTQTTFTFSH